MQPKVVSRTCCEPDGHGGNGCHGIILASRPRWNEHHDASGIIMAGNIPWVGFHDLLCVLLAGHQAVVKPSSEDAGLTAALLADLVADLGPELAAAVRLANGKIRGGGCA
jgi:acyl-CoA reductase-like NAD-dependent aldehyde dehydrogenase